MWFKVGWNGVNTIISGSFLIYISIWYTLNYIEYIHIKLFYFSWGKHTIGYILLHNYPCILAQIVVNCSIKGMEMVVIKLSHLSWSVVHLLGSSPNRPWKDFWNNSWPEWGSVWKWLNKDSSKKVLRWHRGLSWAVQGTYLSEYHRSNFLRDELGRIKKTIFVVFGYRWE